MITDFVLNLASRQAKPLERLGKSSPWLQELRQAKACGMPRTQMTTWVAMRQLFQSQAPPQNKT